MTRFLMPCSRGEVKPSPLPWPRSTQTLSDARDGWAWFLVHPVGRGPGLGRTLLLEALRFCRGRGFASAFLWTFSELQTATHLYRSAGFRETEHKTHPIWGKMIAEERCALVLPADRERA